MRDCMSLMARAVRRISALPVSGTASVWMALANRLATLAMRSSGRVRLRTINDSNTSTVTKVNSCCTTLSQVRGLALSRKYGSGMRAARKIQLSGSSCT